MDSNYTTQKNRHRARKLSVDLLFEAESRNTTPEVIANYRFRLIEKHKYLSKINIYTVLIVCGVTRHAEYIDNIISSHLQNWQLERLPAVDRAILRVAVWELLYSNDVPEPVTIDEAVELAKKFSTDESPKFINGVLGKIILIT